MNTLNNLWNVNKSFRFEDIVAKFLWSLNENIENDFIFFGFVWNEEKSIWTKKENVV